MTKSNRNKALSIILICFPILFACSHTEKVLVPPRIDLKPYKAIGVIDFSSTPRDDLREYVTQNYIQIGSIGPTGGAVSGTGEQGACPHEDKPPGT